MLSGKMNKQVYSLLLAFVLILLHSCKDDEIARVSKVTNTGLVVYGTSATASANIIDLSDADHDDYGFCFSTGSEPTINDSKVGYGFIEDRKAYTGNLTNLYYNTTYYCRPYIMEDDVPIYGDIKTCIIDNTQDLVVITNTVNVTSTTTANVNATVTGIGSLRAIAFGVCYNTSGTPTITDNFVSLGELGKDSIYNATMQGLDVMPDYFVRAYVKLDDNTVIYGNELSFNISEPQILTGTVSIGSSETATIIGNLVSLGIYPVTDHGYCFGTTADPTISGSHFSFGVTTQTGSIGKYLTGLTAGLTYHARAYIVTNGNTYYGNDVLFTIEDITLVTQSATVNGGNTALLSGTLTIANFPIIDRGHCWNNLANPTINNFFLGLGQTNNSGNINVTATGLNTGSIYYCRAYAKDSFNIFYGQELSFAQNYFAVTSIGVSNTGNLELTATGSLEIDGNVNVLEYGHCWIAGGGIPTINDNRSNYGATASSVLNYTTEINGLQQSSYSIRAYATDGTIVKYGNTIAYTPNNYFLLSNDIATMMPFEIDVSTALNISGSVTILNRGHCWSTNTTPTLQNTHTSLGSTNTSGTFLSAITNLPLGVQYYARSFAYSNTDTVYGTIIPIQLHMEQVNNFPVTSRAFAFSFVINNKGYVGGGMFNLPNESQQWLNDFWEYNETADTWSQKANFGGGQITHTATFAIDNDGYVVTGANSVGYVDNGWKYNSGSNTWSQISDLPGGARYGCIGFSANGKGYIGLGKNTTYYNDLWQYEPQSDMWVQKAYLPDNGFYGGTCFTLNDIAYCGMGVMNNNGSSRWYEYNTLSDIWIPKSNLPINGEAFCNGFEINNVGYIFTAQNNSNKVLKYEPISDTWEEIVQLNLQQYGMTTFALGNSAFFMFGTDMATPWQGYHSEVYKFEE